jgi:hypothetical protein
MTNPNMLFIGLDTSAQRNIFIGGDTSFNGRLFTGSDVSLNSRLYVGLDTSLNGCLFVAGDTSLNGRLFVKSDVSINSNIIVGNNLYYNGYFTNTTSSNFKFSITAFSVLATTYSTQFMDMSTNQTVNGQKTFGGLLTASYDVSITKGNLYVSNMAVMNNDVSANKRVFIGKDVSMNRRVFMNTALNIGRGSGLTGFPYILDTSSSSTGGYGAMRIYEKNGTVPSTSGGSITLQHADASGVSSIVFLSKSNYSKDYGSIAYYDSISGSLTSGASKYNYYNITKSTTPYKNT